MKGFKGLTPIPKSQLHMVLVCAMIMISPLVVKFLVWSGASEWQRAAIVLIVDITICAALIRLNRWLERNQ